MTSVAVAPKGLSRLSVAISVALLVSCWALIWTQSWHLNPLLFVGMWVGAAFVMYALGKPGYPGWRAHLLLLGLSVPIWWWFELVNYRVENWEYLGRGGYTNTEYFVLASAAFSTVVPALHAAWSVTVGRLGLNEPTNPAGTPGPWTFLQALAGVGLLGMVFAWPDLFFPMVWVGPFLLLDGLVGLSGGRSLTAELARGRWKLAAGVGAGGVLCGVLWEFWNFWAAPKWIYHLPYLDFIDVFEMPLLGYGGYVPFAWSVYQLLNLRPVALALDRAVQAAVAPHRRS